MSKTKKQPMPSKEVMQAFNRLIEVLEDEAYYAANPAAEAEVNRQILASKRGKK